MAIDEQLVELLLGLEQADKDARLQLLKDGSLFEGYAPEMERVHIENAERLAPVLEEHGWPGIALVGEGGARAAWLVAQNAISQPDFQRRCLELLSRAVQLGDAPATHAAYLTDRIRFNERKPQVFGTIFDWDEGGQLSPWQLDDMGGVDERRDHAGLPPLDETTEIVRLEAQLEGNTPPADHAARQREIDEWSRRTGWI